MPITIDFGYNSRKLDKKSQERKAILTIRSNKQKPNENKKVAGAGSKPSKLNQSITK